MMTGVIYRGDGDDIRELNAADLKQAGVEEGFRATRFPVGVIVDVNPDVADALVSEDIFGNFDFAEAENPEASSSEVAKERAESAAAKKSNLSNTKKESEPTSSGTVQSSGAPTT